MRCLSLKNGLSKYCSGIEEKSHMTYLMSAIFFWRILTYEPLLLKRFHSEQDFFTFFLGINFFKT